METARFEDRKRELFPFNLHPRWLMQGVGTCGWLGLISGWGTKCTWTQPSVPWVNTDSSLFLRGDSGSCLRYQSPQRPRCGYSISQVKYFAEEEDIPTPLPPTDPSSLSPIYSRTCQASLAPTAYIWYIWSGRVTRYTERCLLRSSDLLWGETGMAYVTQVSAPDVAPATSSSCYKLYICHN